MPRRMFDSGHGPADLGEERHKVVIELYCGSCSFARFMNSVLRWTAWYICIDRLPQHELERKYQAWDLAGFLAQPYVVYIQRDLGKISPQKLELWCRSHTDGCTIADVVALQASFDCRTLSRAGACNDTEVRTPGGGAVSLTAQYDSQHFKQLCTTLRYIRATVPTALVSVENPWPGHFKEHRLVQEMIEDKVFYLYKTNFCAAATEALDGAVTVTAAGGLAGGVFSMKTSALLLAGVDPKATMPLCKRAACRMVIPHTSIHAWVIQSKSKKKKGSDQAGKGSRASGSGQVAASSTSKGRQSAKKGKKSAKGSEEEEEETHPAQQRVPQAVNSRVPLGLWAHVWKAHQSWLAAADGYSSWCSICHEGGMCCFVMRMGVMRCSTRPALCRITLQRSIGGATTAG